MTGRPMTHADVGQVRRLRDGRVLAEITRCPWCGVGHWLMTDSTMSYAPCGPNRVILLDGLGTVVR